MASHWIRPLRAESGWYNQVQEATFRRFPSLKDVPYSVDVILLLFACSLVLTGARFYRTRRLAGHAKKPYDGNVKERRPGVWYPVPFERPIANPYPEWSVYDTRPRPYRPFRWGPYHVTMGLRKMDWDEWIELDNHYLKYHAEKARRINVRGDKCCRTDTDPQAFEGACELLEEFADYLSERYPSMYERTPQGVKNTVTHEDFDLRSDRLCVNNGAREDPMQLAARMVQDDLAIVFEKEDGQYYLLAAAILLPGFWRLQDKWKMSLSEIHTSGDVPKFKQNLEKGMMSLFRRMKPDSPVARNNYFLQADDVLAWSPSIGDEDEEGIGWYTAAKDNNVQHHHFRSERQTLRRLPKSGGIVFTIRTYFHPIVEIAHEPGIPGRLASSIRSWTPDVDQYKGKDVYGDALLAYLDQKHQEQVVNGLDESAEEEKYPW